MKVRALNLNSTSTGTYPSTGSVPLYGIYDKFGISVQGGAAITFQPQGSIDGVNWTSLAVATTSDGTSMHSFTTGGNIASLCRVIISANGSTSGTVTLTFAGLR